MNKETFEKLKPYEVQLRNAVNCDFVHMSSYDFCKVANIYAEVFGKELTQRQKNCNTCRLNALKELGAEYKAYKDKMENKENKPKKERKKKIDDKA